MTLPVYNSSVTTESPDLLSVAGKGNEALAQGAKSIQNAVSQAEKYMTTSDVTKTADQMKNQYTNNFKGQATIDQADAAYSTYAHHVINTTSLPNRGYVGAMLSQNYSSLNDQLNTQNAKYNKAQNALTFNDNYQTINGQMESAVKAAGSNPSQDPAENPELAQALTLHAAAVNMTKGQVLTNNLSAAQGISTINQTTDNLHKGYALGQYTNAKQLQAQDPVKYADAPAKIRKQFISGKYKDIRPDQYQSVNSGFNAIDAQFKGASDINKQNLSNQKANALIDMTANGKADPVTVGGIYSADPDGAASFKMRLDATQDVHNQIAEAQGSYPQFEQLAKHFALPLQGSDASSPNAFAKVEANKRGLNFVNSILTQAKTNPAALSETVPLVQQQIDNAKAAPGYVDQPDPIKQLQFLTNAKVQANVDQQRSQQYPDSQISGITDGEGAAIASDINNSSSASEQATKLIGWINSVDPKNQPYFIRGLQKYLPAASSFILKANGSNAYKQYIPDMLLAYGKKTTDPDFMALKSNTGLSDSNIMQAFNTSPAAQNYHSQLLTSSGNPGPEYTKYENHGALLTMQFMSQGKSLSVASNLAAEAQSGDVSYHSLLLNGSTIATPPDLNYLDLQRGMSVTSDILDKGQGDLPADKLEQYGINFNSIKVPATVAQSYGHNFNQSDLKTLYLNGSHWANNSANNGVTLLDNNKDQVYDENGKAVGLTFDTIKDPAFQALMGHRLSNIQKTQLLKAKGMTDIKQLLKKNEFNLVNDLSSSPQLKPFSWQQSSQPFKVFS